MVEPAPGDGPPADTGHGALGADNHPGCPVAPADADPGGAGGSAERGPTTDVPVPSGVRGPADPAPRDDPGPRTPPAPRAHVLPVDHGGRDSSGDRHRPGAWGAGPGMRASDPVGTVGGRLALRRPARALAAARRAGGRPRPDATTRPLRTRRRPLARLDLADASPSQTGRTGCRPAYIARLRPGRATLVGLVGATAWLRLADPKSHLGRTTTDQACPAGKRLRQPVCPTSVARLCSARPAQPRLCSAPRSPGRATALMPIAKRGRA